MSQVHEVSQFEAAQAAWAARLRRRLFDAGVYPHTEVTEETDGAYLANIRERLLPDRLARLSPTALVAVYRVADVLADVPEPDADLPGYVACCDALELASAGVDPAENGVDMALLEPCAIDACKTLLRVNARGRQ